jgi:hypothetical protein
MRSTVIKLLCHEMVGMPHQLRCDIAFSHAGQDGRGQSADSTAYSESKRDVLRCNWTHVTQTHSHEHRYLTHFLGSKKDIANSSKMDCSCICGLCAPVCLIKLSPAKARSSGFSLGKGLALMDRALGS